MREKGDVSLVDSEGGAQPRPEDQQAAPPVVPTGTPHQLTQLTWPRTLLVSASSATSAACDDCNLIAIGRSHISHACGLVLVIVMLHDHVHKGLESVFSLLGANEHAIDWLYARKR